MKLREWLLNNIGLKILALAIAVFSWFYIYIELKRGTIEERRAAFSFLRYKVVSKRLPVKVILTGHLPDDYIIKESDIAADPPTVHVIGPEVLLGKVDYVYTLPVDISEYRKVFEAYVPLAPIAPGIALENETVKISVPIVGTGE